MSHELQTLMTELFPPTCGIRLTEVIVEDQSVQVQLTAIAPTALCPDCATPSSSVHSHYQRRLADLPGGSLAVRIQLLVRKFVCRQLPCARRIFTERLPDVAAPYARKTRRLVNALQAIGIALGGQAGARLAARLRLPASAATLLRLVRAAPIPPMPGLQAVGVDEWAWRRGHRYGTILVDLATHRVVDLLPDRSAATLAAWLAQHSSITVIGRDRSPLDAEGIRQGAPDAVQVVDRFHLVENLREAVEAFLVTQRPVLQAAAVRTAQALTSLAAPVPATPMYGGKRRCAQTGQQQREAARQRRHAPWGTCYEAIHALYAQGTLITAIAQQLGISRPTVYAYLRRTTPPAPRCPQRSGQVLRPYLPYLIRRWRGGISNSMQLWRAIQAQGYAYSARPVCRFITQLRRAADAGLPPQSQGSPYTRPRGPSVRAVSFAVVCPAAKRSREAQMYLDQLCQMDVEIARANALIQTFLSMVRERRGDALKAWMAEATHSGIAALARFARGLQNDLSAISAGLTLEWSNGVTEGQSHRLKLVKRQGYGRAGFALFRQRVLQAA
jgi:transposase